MAGNKKQKEKELNLILAEVEDLIYQFGYYEGVGLYLGDDIHAMLEYLYKQLVQLFARLSVLSDSMSSPDIENKIIDRIAIDTEYVPTYKKLLFSFDKLKANPPEN